MIEFPADNIQGGVFLAPTAEHADARKIWSNLFGAVEPDGYQRSGQLPAMQSTANGTLDGFSINIQSQVGRVDIYLTTHVNGFVDISQGPPRIADVGNGLSTIGRLLEKLCTHVTPLRIAIIADMSVTARAGDETRLLNDAIGIFKVKEGTSDFSFQMNLRKRFDSFEEIPMNRLMTIVSGQIGFIPTQLQPAMQLPSQPMQMSPYVGLKIDVNTAPEVRLPHAAAPLIINEMIAELGEMRRTGLKRLL